jgi:hypothetical protein
MILLSCLGATLWLRAALTGVPDVFFHPSIAYTPAQGPTNPALLDSRPEAIIQRYLADYLRLAGTYPCVQNLTSQYYDGVDDQFLQSGSCPITRPVASYGITAVTIQAHGLLGRPEALVTIAVRYSSGQQWTGTIGMYPHQLQSLMFVWFHLDCWSSLGTLAMFGQLVPEIPAGAEYLSRDGLMSYCKDHAGHIINDG